MSAKTDEEALDKVKKLLTYLPSSYQEKPPKRESETKDNYCPDLADIVPFDSTRPYGVKEVIEQVVDPDSFFEIHKDFAKNIVVGFARIEGKTVGLVCNQPKYLAGSVDIDSSDKAARFIRFCDSFNTI